jgi:hypothetical protein
LFLRLTDRKDESLFVGQWAAPLLLFGVYNKLVKVAGSDRVEANSWAAIFILKSNCFILSDRSPPLMASTDPERIANSDSNSRNRKTIFPARVSRNRTEFWPASPNVEEGSTDISPRAVDQRFS